MRLLVVPFSMMIITASAGAATIIVPADYATIQGAVDAASSGDLILVWPGTYTSNTGPVVDMMGKAVTLQSAGTADETILDGQGSHRVIDCVSGEGTGTVIDGFTLTGGVVSGNGGGLRILGSSPIVLDCTIVNCSVAAGPGAPHGTVHGGGVYCQDSLASFVGCNVIDCTAYGDAGGDAMGGGIACVGGAPTFLDCNLDSNRGSYYSLYCGTDSAPIFHNCNIRGSSWDGAVGCRDSRPTMTNCTIENNDTNGLTLQDCGGTFSDCFITNNYSHGYPQGEGGVTISGCSTEYPYPCPEFVRCSISSNYSSSSKYSSVGGIGVWNSGVSFIECIIADNVGTASGGIHSSGCRETYPYPCPTFIDCWINGNISDDGIGILTTGDGMPEFSGTLACRNGPTPISGPWVDNGGNCLTEYCEDVDQDGTPDGCDPSVGDGIHNVPAEYPTIHMAVSVANPGDTVLLASGTYFGTGDEVVDLSGKEITLRGSGGPEATILDGEGSRLVIRFNNNETSPYCHAYNGNTSAPTIIESLTITGGSGLFGGGLYSYCALSQINDCRFIGNYGGGAFCEFSVMTISDCYFANNVVNNNITWTDGGAMSSVNSNVTLTNCVVEFNRSEFGSGGGINASGGDLTLAQVSAFSNSAFGAGGAISAFDCNVMIDNLILEGNTAGTGGGASFGGSQDGSNPIVIIDASTITSNSGSEWGGGLVLGDNTLPIITSTQVCENVPNQITGSYSDEGGNSIGATCPETGACCTDSGGCVIVEQFDCYLIQGSWLGIDVECGEYSCQDPCPADLDGSGQVDGIEVAYVIAAWATTSPLADIDGNGIVGVQDLLLVLDQWGPCS